MLEVSTIGLDLAKKVFQVHGADASGGVLVRKKLRRDQVLKFLAAQPACTVAMEACASAKVSRIRLAHPESGIPNESESDHPALASKLANGFQSIRSTHCAREGPGSNGSPKY